MLVDIGWHHWVDSGAVVNQHLGTDTVQDGPAQIFRAQPPGEGILIPVFVGRAFSRRIVYWAGVPGTWGSAGLAPTNSIGAWPPFVPTPPRGFKDLFFLSSRSLSCWSDTSWSSRERGSLHWRQWWPSFWQLKQRPCRSSLTLAAWWRPMRNPSLYHFSRASNVLFSGSGLHLPLLQTAQGSIEQLKGHGHPIQGVQAV